MAALRLLARAALSTVARRSTNAILVGQVQKRWGSYKSSPVYKEPSQYTDYEVSKDPQEWEYIKHLLKPEVVPVPPMENQSYPSGWKPPTCKPRDYPYYVQRSRNYMLPVYMQITFRGLRKVTALRRINGDIWALESELTEYLEKSTNKKVGVRINELIGEIKFRGDYVSHIKHWLETKGF